MRNATKMATVEMATKEISRGCGCAKSNRSIPYSDSNRIRTRIGWGNPASDVSTEVFPKLQNGGIAIRKHACTQVNSCLG